MKRKKSKKRRTKYWYLQNFGTYTNQVPVFVGYSKKEITSIIKRQKNWKPEAKKAWVDDHGDERPFIKHPNGFCWFHNDGFALLYLEKYENDWDSHDTLVHECFHLVVNCLGKQKALINFTSGVIEEEALAYEHEYLVREIRRKLQQAFSL